MGDQHLQKLESALVQKGWSILQRENKIDWYTAGTWEIQRSKRVGPFHLKFVAFDWLGSPTVRDLPSAWSCKLSEEKAVSLYFWKLKSFAPKLRQFIVELDKFETQELERKKNA